MAALQADNIETLNSVQQFELYIEQLFTSWMSAIGYVSKWCNL